MTRMVPNSYQKPNLYTDKLLRFLTGDEWKTLDYALRRTYGFGRESDRISVSQFMNGNGRLDEAGQLLEHGTGLNKEAQIEALNELIRFGILVELAPNDTRNTGRLWKLQLDEQLLRFDLIHERDAARRRRGQKRTAKARKAALDARGEERSDVQTNSGLIHRPPPAVWPTDQGRSDTQTGGGLARRPEAVCPTDTQKPRRNQTRNQEETQSSGEVGQTVVEAWLALVDLCAGNEKEAEAVWRLQEKFAAVTQLKRPDPATGEGRAKLLREWWPQLRQVLEDADNNHEAAEAAIEEAFNSMTQRPAPLNVVGPRSIVGVAASVLAGKRRGDKAQARGLVQRPKGMTGIDAYAGRRGNGTQES